MYTDTDALLCSIESNDLFAEMAPLTASLFDCSNLDPEQPLHNTSNALKLGMLKDEAAGQTITEYIGLKSKMHIKTVSSEKKIGKGIPGAALKTQVNRDHYYYAINAN